MEQAGLRSVLDQDEAVASGGSATDALFKPVLLKKPVAAATHPSWVEDDDAAALSTQSVMAGAKDGQQHVDLKPFKGRGAGRRLREAQEAVDKIHEEMRQLAELSKSVKGRQIYLTVHARASSGQASLRWRRAGTVEKTSHIAWRDLEQWLAPLEWELAQWYRTTNATAVALNEQEKDARAALRTAETLAKRGVDQDEIQIALPSSSRKLPEEI